MAFDAQGLLGSLFSGSLAVAFWIILGLIVATVIIGLVWYFWIYRKQFDIRI